MTTHELAYHLVRENPVLMFWLFLCFMLLSFLLASNHRVWFRRFIFVLLPSAVLKDVRKSKKGLAGHESQTPKGYREHVGRELAFLRGQLATMDRSLTRPKRRESES